MRLWLSWSWNYGKTKLGIPAEPLFRSLGWVVRSEQQMRLWLSWSWNYGKTKRKTIVQDNSNFAKLG